MFYFQRKYKGWSSLNECIDDVLQEGDEKTREHRIGEAISRVVSGAGIMVEEEEYSYKIMKHCSRTDDRMLVIGSTVDKEVIEKSLERRKVSYIEWDDLIQQYDELSSVYKDLYQSTTIKWDGNYGASKMEKKVAEIENNGVDCMKLNVSALSFPIPSSPLLESGGVYSQEFDVMLAIGFPKDLDDKDKIARACHAVACLRHYIVLSSLDNVHLAQAIVAMPISLDSEIDDFVDLYVYDKDETDAGEYIENASDTVIRISADGQIIRTQEKIEDILDSEQDEDEKKEASPAKRRVRNHYSQYPLKDCELMLIKPKYSDMHLTLTAMLDTNRTTYSYTKRLSFAYSKEEWRYRAIDYVELDRKGVNVIVCGSYTAAEYGNNYVSAKDRRGIQFIDTDYFEKYWTLPRKDRVIAFFDPSILAMRKRLLRGRYAHVTRIMLAADFDLEKRIVKVLFDSNWDRMRKIRTFIDKKYIFTQPVTLTTKRIEKADPVTKEITFSEPHNIGKANYLHSNIINESSLLSIMNQFIDDAMEKILDGYMEEAEGGVKEIWKVKTLLEFEQNLCLGKRRRRHDTVKSIKELDARIDDIRHVSIEYIERRKSWLHDMLCKFGVLSVGGVFHLDYSVLVPFVARNMLNEIIEKSTHRDAFNLIHKMKPEGKYAYANTLLFLASAIGDLAYSNIYDEATGSCCLYFPVSRILVGTNDPEKYFPLIWPRSDYPDGVELKYAPYIFKQQIEDYFEKRIQISATPDNMALCSSPLMDML
jgi:hypothetical protein